MKKLALLLAFLVVSGLSATTTQAANGPAKRASNIAKREYRSITNRQPSHWKSVCKKRSKRPWVCDSHVSDQSRSVSCDFHIVLSNPTKILGVGCVAAEQEVYD